MASQLRQVLVSTRRACEASLFARGLTVDSLRSLMGMPIVEVIIAVVWARRYNLEEENGLLVEDLRVEVVV